MWIRRLAAWTLAFTLTCMLLVQPALADDGGKADTAPATGTSQQKDSGADLSRLQEVLKVLQQTYKGGVDLNKVIDGAIKGALDSLNDPFTEYFPPTNYNDFMSSLNGEVSGIGTQVERGGDYIRVALPYEGSPAAKAGLKIGDLILEVDGSSLKGMTLDAAVARIRGAAGTKVKLKIQRPDENREFTVEIVRELIKVTLVHTKMLTDKIGYLRLDQFSEDSPTLVLKGLDELQKKGATSWVFDLRNNPGGYLDAAWSIGSLFVPKGKPVVRIETPGQLGVWYQSMGLQRNMPVVALVNENTASAAEIVTGAIQDYKAGPVVGVKTYGKGTVQQIYNLSGGAGVKVTVSEYLTGEGHHVHKVGITPDYVVAAYKPDTERTADLTLDRSLQLMNSGLDVLHLQQHLVELGYNVGEESGFLNTATKAAVDKFQKDYGLPQTGLVDKNMVATINQAMHQVLATRKLTAPDPQLDKALELAKALDLARGYQH